MSEEEEEKAPSFWENPLAYREHHAKTLEKQRRSKVFQMVKYGKEKMGEKSYQDFLKSLVDSELNDELDMEVVPRLEDKKTLESLAVSHEKGEIREMACKRLGILFPESDEFGGLVEYKICKEEHKKQEEKGKRKDIMRLLLQQKGWR